MSSNNEGTLSSLLSVVQDFAATKSINLIIPSDGDWDSTALCLIINPTNKPLAIVRPKTPDDISAIIKFCTSRSVPFVVRNGGHDSAGRSQVNGALTIDLRDMNNVAVAADRKTARVSGGASLGDVADVLAAEALVTPTGANSTVGYVGWATCAGYGLLANHWGLGVDQILAAKLVNWAGDLIDADDELLKGIRGAGPAFGVIVELTIKVYPLDSVLSGMIVYDTSDFQATLDNWFKGYERLAAGEGIPSSLGIQLLIVQIPDLGRVVLSLVMWSDKDQVKGQQWIDKIATLGTNILRTVEPSKIRDFMRANDNSYPYGAYGHNNTISVRGFTPKVKAIIAKYTDKFPTFGNGFCTHLLSGPSAQPNPHSVFGSRVEHVVFELFTAIADSDETKVAESIAWGKAFKRELLEKAPEDVIDGAFAALLTTEDTDLRKIYGENYDFLIALKKKHDPQNVFRNTIPRLL